ncbi:MAG: glycosyltransferase family 2 protein [Planctomycetia bacterium]
MTTASRGAGAAISAVIITREAGRHLAAVLAPLTFCAERLVLDSGSTDDTVAIATAAGGRVEHQPFLGYGPQKARAVALARHDWILSIDADEVLDEEAAAAIRDLDLSDPTACWELRRRTFIGGREILHGPWQDERVVRLFNRTRAGFRPLVVHEQVEGATNARLLPGSILHRSYDDLVDVLARPLRYAPLKATLIRDKGESVRLWTLPLRAAWAFCQAFFVRGGWRDGAAGFVIAVARALESTLPRALLLFGRRG